MEPGMYTSIKIRESQLIALAPTLKYFIANTCTGEYFEKIKIKTQAAQIATYCCPNQIVASAHDGKYCKDKPPSRIRFKSWHFFFVTQKNFFIVFAFLRATQTSITTFRKYVWKLKIM